MFTAMQIRLNSPRTVVIPLVRNLLIPFFLLYLQTQVQRSTAVAYIVLLLGWLPSLPSLHSFAAHGGGTSSGIGCRPCFFYIVFALYRLNMFVLCRASPLFFLTVVMFSCKCYCLTHWTAVFVSFRIVWKVFLTIRVFLLSCYCYQVYNRRYGYLTKI